MDGSRQVGRAPSMQAREAGPRRRARCDREPPCPWHSCLWRSHSVSSRRASARPWPPQLALADRSPAPSAQPRESRLRMSLFARFRKSRTMSWKSRAPSPIAKVATGSAVSRLARRTWRSPAKSAKRARRSVIPNTSRSTTATPPPWATQLRSRWLRGRRGRESTRPCPRSSR